MPSTDYQPVPPAPIVRDLAVAFDSMTRSSLRLEEAYRRLVRRVQEVDRELVETNERLNRKVEELDCLTRYLNDILARMHSGVVAVDDRGRVTSFNDAAERVLGVPAAEVVGQARVDGAFRNADGSASPLMLTLTTGEPIRDFEREVVTATGQRLCLTSSVSPIRTAGGRLVGAVEIFSDLTEVRELQERLDCADKLAALGQMTAQVAHEIRNPLNSIEGFASLLVRDLEGEDPRRRFAGHIVTSARSLSQIVTNMLDFSQPFVVRARPMSLHAVVGEALAFAAEEARHLGCGPLDIETDLAPEADDVRADPDLIRHALLNLLANALQAMPGGGTLRVSARSAEVRGSGDEWKREDASDGATRHASHAPRHPASRAGWVELRVADTGPGIPEEIRSKVLDPFFTTRSRGTGLGLAIVQKIARRHGGHLDIESDADRGTTAVLAIPRRGSEEAGETDGGGPSVSPFPAATA